MGRGVPRLWRRFWNRPQKSGHIYINGVHVKINRPQDAKIPHCLFNRGPQKAAAFFPESADELYMASIQNTAEGYLSTEKKRLFTR
jgi:hypothetical protein